MTILLIVIVVCAVVELLILIIGLRKENSKRIKMEKNLYKLIERRVLDQSLKYRISSGQATYGESRMVFLYVEFLDTKPVITYLFALDEWITIGRSKENKICIHNDMFSRLHCKIGYVNDNLFLIDQGSVNGSYIKKGLFKKIYVGPGGQEILKTGDVVVIGQYRMKIQIVYGYDIIN